MIRIAFFFIISHGRSKFLGARSDISKLKLLIITIQYFHTFECHIFSDKGKLHEALYYREGPCKKLSNHENAIRSFVMRSAHADLGKSLYSVTPSSRIISKTNLMREFVRWIISRFIQMSKIQIFKFDLVMKVTRWPLEHILRFWHNYYRLLVALVDK